MVTYRKIFYDGETDSPIIAAIVLVVVFTVPVKFVAPLFGAKNTSFVASGLSLIVGIARAMIGGSITGSVIISAYVGLVAGFISVLRASILGTLIMPTVVLIIGLGILQLISGF